MSFFSLEETVVAVGIRHAVVGHTVVIRVRHITVVHIVGVAVLVVVGHARVSVVLRFGFSFGLTLPEAVVGIVTVGIRHTVVGHAVVVRRVGHGVTVVVGHGTVVVVVGHARVTKVLGLGFSFGFGLSFPVTVVSVSTVESVSIRVGSSIVSSVVARVTPWVVGVVHGRPVILSLGFSLRLGHNKGHDNGSKDLKGMIFLKIRCEKRFFFNLR